jgi:peptide chain release factor subunit 1
MSRFNFLQKLLDFEPVQGPFISVYLDTRVNENGTRTFDVVLRKLISEQLDRLGERADERTAFEEDVEKINSYLTDLDPTVQGVALFACSKAGLFQHFDFQVPFDENMLFVFDRPHLYPIIKLVGQNRRFAVAQADTNSAHIYVFGRGETFFRDDIQNVKTNRSEVGGWSQMRYQRHLENFHQQHAKDVVAELEKLVRDDHIERIILAGDETVIVPILKAEIGKELEDKIIGTMSLSVNAPEYEVLEEADKVVHRCEMLEAARAIENLNEQNHDNGLGVTGMGKVLPALFNGQVQELYISSDFENVEFNAGQVNKIFKDYAPGIGEDLPSAKRTGLVIDEALRIAAQTADDIRFIDDDNLLKDAGGIGALLRYQAKGVNV